MTRKQLPKAIKPSGSNLRFIPVETEAEAPARPIGPAPGTAVEPAPSVAASPVAAAPKSEIEIWPPSPPPDNDALPVATLASKQAEAEKRLRLAFRIVDRYRMFAGIGGLVPMPAVNVVSVTAVNLRMVKALSDLYGVPFERDKTRSVVIGLLGGAAPTGLAAATSATLAFAAPVAGAVGIAVSSVAAATLTRRIGVYYVALFESDAAL